MKKVLLIVLFVMFTFILGVVFLLIGMNIGGNYFTDFELFGARGYEATSNLGFFIGIILGIVLSIVFYKIIVKKISNKDTE